MARKTKPKTERDPLSLTNLKVAFFAPYEIKKSQILEIEDRANTPFSQMEKWGDFNYNPASEDDIRQQVNNLFESIHEALKTHGNVALFGTFIPPIQEYILRRDQRERMPNLFLFESWHHKDHGQKKHIRWKQTGEYHL